jgi:hypothetical protein
MLAVRPTAHKVSFYKWPFSSKDAPERTGGLRPDLPIPGNEGDPRSMSGVGETAVARGSVRNGKFVPIPAVHDPGNLSKLGKRSLYFRVLLKFHFDSPYMACRHFLPVKADFPPILVMEDFMSAASTGVLA